MLFRSAVLTELLLVVPDVLVELAVLLVLAVVPEIAVVAMGLAQGRPIT